MKIKTLLALGVFAVLCAGTASAQLLFFSPPVTTPATTTFTVDLALDHLGAVVQGIDAFFTYDPAIVQLDGVAAGDWFTSSGLGFYFWSDPAAPPGEVHLSTSLLGAGQAASGVVATLQFTALAAGVSPLEFMTLSVRDDANAALPASHSDDDRIVIEEVVSSDDWTVSDTKRHYR